MSLLLFGAINFVPSIRKEYGSEDKVKDGVFGAMMKVDIANDGPGRRDRPQLR